MAELHGREHVEIYDEKRPVCMTCHREVQPWNWALTPIKPPRQPIILVAVCHPQCKVTP